MASTANHRTRPRVSEATTTAEQAAFFSFPEMVATWRSLPAAAERYLLSPANPYRNVAGVRLFVCREGTTIIARVAYISDRRSDAAYFGFFDSANNPDAAAMLLAALENAARTDGKTRLEGPFNPNHYSPGGVLLNCFDAPPGFYQNWNPPYYADLLENSGYAVCARGRIWRNADVQKFLSTEFRGWALPVQSGRHSVRHLSVAGDNPMKTLDIINGSFGNNLRFQEISREEFRYVLRLFLPAVEKRLAAVAFCDESPVGAVVCLNDIPPASGMPTGRVVRDRLRLMFRPHPSNLVMFAIGLLPEHRGGRAALLLRNAVALMASRYSTADSSWITDGNTASEQMAGRFGMTPRKEFAIFGKNLTA